MRYKPVLLCLQQVRHLVEPAIIVIMKWSIFKYSLRHPRRHFSNKEIHLTEGREHKNKLIGLL